MTQEPITSTEAKHPTMLTIHWFLPTGGDSDVVPTSSDAHRRAPSLAYLAQVPQAADQLGFDEFILSGYPHLEEAYWFGEVLPRLRERGLVASLAESPAAAPVSTFR